MDEPKEFPSPLIYQGHQNLPDKLPKPIVVPLPAVFNRPALKRFIQLAGGLRDQQAEALVGFLEAFHRDLPFPHQAIIGKIVQPRLTDARIAMLCCVDPSKISRCQEYQNRKPDIEAYLKMAR